MKTHTDRPGYQNCKIAVAIRAARAAMGWSQQAFAERMGVAKSTIARIETLEIAPKGDFVLRAIGLFREAGLEIDIQSERGIPITIGSGAILSALDQLNAN